MNDSRGFPALTGALAFGCSALAASHAAPAERFVANTYRIYDERAPESSVSVVEACADDDGCPSGAETAAAYLDLSHLLVSYFPYEYRYDYDADSSETRFKFYIPDDYVLCEFFITRKSYVGDGYLAVTGRPDSVEIYIWMQSSSEFEEGEFVNIRMTIVSVEQSYLWHAIRDGTCGAAEIRRIFLYRRTALP